MTDSRDHTAMLMDILAVIHRDGGQYTHLHGVGKSLEDAVDIVLRLLDKEGIPHDQGRATDEKTDITGNDVGSKISKLKVTGSTHTADGKIGFLADGIEDNRWGVQVLKGGFDLVVVERDLVVPHDQGKAAAIAGLQEGLVAMRDDKGKGWRVVR